MNLRDEKLLMNFLDDLSAQIGKMTLTIESQDGVTDATLQVDNPGGVILVQSIGVACLSNALWEIALTLKEGKKPTRR